MDRVKLDQIIMLVNRVLVPEGFDCIEADWSGNERILCLFVEYVDQALSINLDGCVQASRLLGEFQELDDLVAGKYTLEVSSPGIERPLRRLSHFEKHLGANIQVKLKEKVQERRNGTGRLVDVALAAAEAEAANITLETAEGTWSFPLASLQRASLVYDWGDS